MSRIDRAAKACTAKLFSVCTQTPQIRIEKVEAAVVEQTD
jgi:hypothetical protein